MAEWRSSANSVGNAVENGKVPMPSGRKRPGSSQRPSSGSASQWCGPGVALQFPKQCWANRFWKKRRRMPWLMDRCEVKRKGMGKALAVWRKRADFGRTSHGKIRLEGTGGSIANAQRVRVGEGIRFVYEAKTGVGCDGFHPKVLKDFDKRNKRRCG